MYARKIVLSSDCQNGPIEIIKNGDNGFLYKKNNEVDFYNKFQNVMKIINFDNKNKDIILLSALKKTKSFSLMGHYMDISSHLK